MTINDDLLISAQIIARIKTKKDTVNLAIREFFQRRKQEEVLELFGEIEYDETYDYKEMRHRK